MLDDDLVVSEVSAEEIEMTHVVRERGSSGRWIAGAAVVIVLAIGANIIFGGVGDEPAQDSASPSATSIPATSVDESDPSGEVSLTRVVAASGTWTDQVGWTSLDMFGWRGLLEESCADYRDDATKTAARVVSRYHLDRGVPVKTAGVLIDAALSAGCAEQLNDFATGRTRETEAALAGVERPELFGVSAVSATEFVLPGDFASVSGFVLSERRNGTTAITTDPVAIFTSGGRSADSARLVPNERSLPVFAVSSETPTILRLPNDVGLEPPFAVQVCSLDVGGACGVARFGFAPADQAAVAPSVVDTLSKIWIDEVGWTNRTWREWGEVALAGCQDEASADAIREMVADDPSLAIGTSTELAVHLIWQMAKANCRNRHPGPDVFEGNRPGPWEWFGSFEPGGVILRDNNGGGGGTTLFHRAWGTTPADPMLALVDLSSPEVSPVVTLPSGVWAPGHYRLCPTSAADVVCPARVVLPDGTLAVPLAGGSRVVMLSWTANTPVRGLDLSSGQTDWSRPIGADVDIVAHLGLDDVVVLGLTRRGGSVFVTALDLDTGVPAWTTLLDDPPGNGMRITLDGADLVLEIGDYTPGPAEIVRRLDPATGLLLEEGPIED